MSVNNPNYFQGKMGYVMIDSSIVACAQSYTLDVNRGITEIQCIGSDSIRKIAGPYQWTVSFDALQTLTQDASVGRKSYDDLMAHLVGTTNTVSVYLEPNTTDVSTGQVYYKGDGIIESISRSVSSGSEPTTFSVSIQGSGDLTEYTTS